MLSVSKKRGKPALTQLKIDQLMNRHDMKRRMAELRYHEKLLEPWMDEEQAIVSYKIYNDKAYVDSKSYNRHKSFAANGDVLHKWHKMKHLVDVPITELEVDMIPLIIGLQEKPSTFLSLEYHAGSQNELVAIRYSLG